MFLLRYQHLDMARIGGIKELQTDYKYPRVSFQNISPAEKVFKRDENRIHHERFVEHHTFSLFYVKYQPFVLRKLISRP